jgi:hypothetical protein
LRTRIDPGIGVYPRTGPEYSEGFFGGSRCSKPLWLKRHNPRSFQNRLIENSEAWMNMIQSRNLSSHPYDEGIAAEIVSAIRATYFAEFKALQVKLEVLKKETSI